MSSKVAKFVIWFIVLVVSLGVLGHLSSAQPDKLCPGKQAALWVGASVETFPGRVKPAIHVETLLLIYDPLANGYSWDAWAYTCLPLGVWDHFAKVSRPSQVKAVVKIGGKTPATSASGLTYRSASPFLGTPACADGYPALHADITLTDFGGQPGTNSFSPGFKVVMRLSDKQPSWYPGDERVSLCLHKPVSKIVFEKQRVSNRSTHLWFGAK